MIFDSSIFKKAIEAMNSIALVDDDVNSAVDFGGNSSNTEISRLQAEIHQRNKQIEVLENNIKELQSNLLGQENTNSSQSNPSPDNAGKNQVAIGLVPINFHHKSSESALSVYPIAIGNCKESRENLVQLIQTLNAQKEAIKKEGIRVDGEKYNVKFTGTYMYYIIYTAHTTKPFLLLLTKKNDDRFILGGKGYNTEFCAFCDAIRACTLHGADVDEACVDCLRSKSNIGRPVGLRDDLTFLLEEELHHINLCALHCEMRNCCTERDILINIDDIVRQALPIHKVSEHYKSCTGVGQQVILDYITFFEERKMVSIKMIPFSYVCLDWREIAFCLREKDFEEDKEELIDIHDIKCKEWGFLLRKLFGVHLGTGDYGHLVVDHSAMLLRQFRSLGKYSGQGFEASHKLHRQLFSKATNHDSSGPGQSLDQILTHWYATYLLSLRYKFRQALECINSGNCKQYCSSIT
ncbi:hypothetical protein QZH41_008435 [Actinostola sp. cb2023]|nr:hypothetical protein QZH41_008435 [Actinostola sp. cb2023]